MAEVFLHVGLPKTGTTTIQVALESRASALAGSGILFPGGRHRAQRLAAYDLLGQRIKGDDAVVAGAFARLVEEMAAFTGRSIVVSEEELGLARPRHVRRLVAALPGHQVTVVLGVRDLARTAVSAWQQSIVMGGTTSWQEFIAAVTEEGGPVGAAGSFWLRHDALRAIDSWGAAVPPERVRVVTVPPRGASTSVLLERFSRAVELPPGTWDGADVPAHNVSLGSAELEVLRRLNLSLAGRLNLAQHRFLVEEGIRRRLEKDDHRPLRLPPKHLPWAQEYGARLGEELQRRGVTVVGDLADLVPVAEPLHHRAPDDVTDRELSDATHAALVSLALAHGTLFRRYRRDFHRQQGRLPAASELVSSGARAAGFSLRRAVLRRADDNRLLARAVHTYLRLVR